jgi:hypothetical protein
MKLLTKEEEDAHYNACLESGFYGGAFGIGLASIGVYAASQRWPAFNRLTLPLKAFIVTSTGSTVAIIRAEDASHAFGKTRTADRQYVDTTAKVLQRAKESRSKTEKAFDWAKENRYPIVTASWVASMGIALALVRRNPFLSKAQKLVQARVYAQGLTLAVLIATAAFETHDRHFADGAEEEGAESNHVVGHNEKYAGEDMWKGECIVGVSDCDRLLISETDMVAAEIARNKLRKEQQTI